MRICRDAVVPANRRLTPDPARHLQVFDEFAVVGEVEFFHRIVLLGAMVLAERLRSWAISVTV